ncbi:hypothetical protein ZWY2020_039862 [Hordeum vulgare]|nr:hypothetical protein ZWY2020_005539 [Hordeum vulgare]KAI4991491.1 hypothetical protein ZWY2020_039862 [Hordeum vulgare]
MCCARPSSSPECYASKSLCPPATADGPAVVLLAPSSTPLEAPAPSGDGDGPGGRLPPPSTSFDQEFVRSS